MKIRSASSVFLLTNDEFKRIDSKLNLKKLHSLIQAHSWFRELKNSPKALKKFEEAVNKQEQIY